MPINPSLMSVPTDSLTNNPEDLVEELIFGIIIMPATPAIPELRNWRLDHVLF
jgi:hypothetical protein